ncbi:MAG: hypothetical protein M1835_006811 [Candelina submexicana]|nr:MAG: hypothetical protein M1835_006811 [Candelina submexicana]
MAVCKFYQEGRCKFGERCKFEHPRNYNSVQGQNRFSALQSSESNSASNRAVPAFGGSAGTRSVPYSLSKDVIHNDLAKELPQWILSAYGPGRDAPIQLFGGFPREQSFEEMRLHHYLAAAVGNEQQALQEAQGLVNNAQQQNQAALNDLDGAIKFIVDGVNNHPNRLDICAASKSPNASNTQPQTSYPQPNLPSIRPTITNGTAPMFGQPQGSFGQPSTPALPPTFSQPIQINSQLPNEASGPSSFGRPSQLGANPGFGQPSQLGGGFGQPTQLGSKPNPFGPPSQLGGNTAFGQPSQPNPISQANPFTQHATAANGFSTQGRTTTNGGFGQPSQPTDSGETGQAMQPVTNGGFGQPTQPAAVNPFSRSNEAPYLAAVANPQSAKPTQPNPVFSPPPLSARPTPTSGNSCVSTTYGTAGVNLGNWPKDSTNNPVPFPIQVSDPYETSSSLPHPDIRSYSVRDPKNTLLVWKGQAVYYIDKVPCFKRIDDGTLERIWFPDGPPGYNKETELTMEEYDEATKDAYLFMRDNASFEDGLMPMQPPRREWSTWDF